MSDAPEPPKVGRWIIRVVLPEDLRNDVPRDLDEVFVRKTSERGRQRARLWYWTEVASFSGRFLAERLRLAVGGRRDGPGSTEGSIGGAMGGPMGSSVGERIADLAAELRQVARGLRRRVGFSTLAILTLALGLGASTAIYSVVRGVLLRPLPYPDPGGLVTIRSTNSEWQTSDDPAISHYVGPGLRRVDDGLPRLARRLALSR